MEKINIVDLEELINYWRTTLDPNADASLSVELAELAILYANMIEQRRDWFSLAELSKNSLKAWQVWQSNHPDSPCIGVCSLFQGDVECRGCGRTLQEVADWSQMTFSAKKQVWRRITAEARALGFNQKIERMKSYIPIKTY